MDLSRLVVGITGAGGELGGVLRRQVTACGAKVVAVVLDGPTIAVPGEAKSKDELGWCVEVRAGDLAKEDQCKGLLTGCDVVVHLAALPKPWESFSTIYKNNMLLDHNMFEEAKRAGVKRIVYASTNHVQHGRSMKTSPETLDSSRFGAHLEGGEPLMKASDPPSPDSPYAIGKLTGEGLGSYNAIVHGLEVVSLRIGWIVPEDDPRKSRWVVNSDHKEFMRAMYLGHKDCKEIFTRAIAAELPPSTRVGKGRFGCCYAVSNNTRRVFDLECTRSLLGYSPQENVEVFATQPDW